jgi:hypothetical protein
MKRFVRTVLLAAGTLFSLVSCGEDEAAPEDCIQGVVITNQGCPDAVLIQVLNKPGVGRTVVFGNAYTAVAEYDNVVKTTYPLEEDISALRGKTIYFRYTQPNPKTLDQLNARALCQTVYVNYDVPYVELTGYSLTSCMGN